MAEVQKQQALTAEKVAIEQAKSNFEMQRMQAEAQISKEIMATKFQYDLKLAQAALQASKAKEDNADAAKAKRIEKEGTQQSQLIEQRQNKGMPKDFEEGSGGAMEGMDMSQFMPQ